MKSVTPDSLKSYLKDRFKKITLYSNKVREAAYRKLGDTKFEVTIHVESVKNYFDGNGKLLAEGDQANLLEIAVFDNDIENTQGMTTKSPLALERICIKPGKSSYTYITNKLPIRAGIDPYNKMIARIPYYNLLILEEITN